MTDWGIYWKFFVEDEGACTGWNTNSQRLKDIVSLGDWIWLFACGRSCARLCGEEYEPQLGYLAEIFVVKRIGNAPDGNRKFRIDADEERCFLIEPPLLVDELIRPRGRARSDPIGELRQTPWNLKEIVEQLKSSLRQERPALYEAAFGGMR
jgi:hypothetical protein